MFSPVPSRANPSRIDSNGLPSNGCRSHDGGYQRQQKPALAKPDFDQCLRLDPTLRAIYEDQMEKAKLLPAYKAWFATLPEHAPPVPAATSVPNIGVPGSEPANTVIGML